MWEGRSSTTQGNSPSPARMCNQYISTQLHHIARKVATIVPFSLKLNASVSHRLFGRQSRHPEWRGTTYLSQSPAVVFMRPADGRHSCRGHGWALQSYAIIFKQASF